MNLVLFGDNNEKYALKMFRSNHFDNELKIISEMKHENIVSIIGWTRNSTLSGIVMKFEEGGTLEEGNDEMFYCCVY